MATRQVIKTGTTVDDGTGDLLRDAFVKVNTNFENVWDKTSVNSNLDFTGDTVTGTGDLIISPASDIKFTKSAIFNSNKGNFDLTVHGDTSDNVLFIDASTNRVGILNNAPTVALDVTGNSAISGNLTVGGTTTLNGNVTIGNAISDIVTYVGRVGSTIEPYGNVTIGSTTNRWNNGYYTNLDVTGTISGTFSGSLDPSTTVTNNINSTTIIGDTITATTSATVGNLLVTGTMAVQGASVTIDSATMQILDRLTFEGATADDFETVIVATDPTADRTITLPDASGTVALGTIPTSILDLGITDGTAGQQLTTDGSGNFSFAASGAGGGIALTDLSVTTASAGTAALSYNNGTGVFDFTPPDLSSYLTSFTETNDLSAAVTWTNVPDTNITQSSVTQHQAALSVTESQISDLGTYLTSVPAQTFASLTGTPTTLAGYGITDALALGTSSTTALAGDTALFDGVFASLTSKPTTIAGYGITDGYANTDVDAHLNQSNPTSGYVLTWNGSDYAWTANGTGSGIGDIVDDTTPQLGGTLDANGNTIDMGTNIITDAKVGQWDTAYGWGDHGSGGYLTSVPAQTFASLTGKPTTVAGYGITDASSASATETLTNKTIDTASNTITIVEADISDLGSYLTSVPAQTFASLTGKPTTLAGYGITDGYANTDVDTHLNQSGPTDGYVLSWTSGDYAWVANAGSGATSINTAGNTGTGSVTFASETLTATGTTNQINVDAAGFALSFSLDADLTGLTTINTHTIPSGTGTLALTGDHPQHTFVIAASGSTDYTFSDADNHWFPTTENDPVLYLRRGETYVFNVDALSGSHPFEIRVSNGGSAYGTGVTNNGATSGNITFKVPMSAPATLYYQCTAHAGMGNTINIV